MIRPRGPPNNIISEGTTSNEQQQDFIYTPVELATMAASITTFAESGLLRPDQGDGFVFGVLRRTATPTPTPTPTPTAQSVSLELDVPRNKHLVDLARSYGFVSVLHRAVDDLFSCTLSSLDRTRTGDGEEDGGTSGAAGPQQQLVESVMERVRECGFDGMLTSGGKGAAGDNVDLVRRVVRAASTMGVEVIVGGGVRSAGLRGLVEGLGTGNLKGVWWHSSCLRAGDDGGKRFDEEEERRLVQEMRVLGLGL
jgi:copper homeostasis protein CutC